MAAGSAGSESGQKSIPEYDGLLDQLEFVDRVLLSFTADQAAV